MTYAQVTKFQAKDGSLHDSEDLARTHDQRRRRDAIREVVWRDIMGTLSMKVSYFDNLPADWADQNGKNMPTQQDIAEAIVDNWDTLAAAFTRAGA